MAGEGVVVVVAGLLPGVVGLKVVGIKQRAVAQMMVGVSGQHPGVWHQFLGFVGHSPRCLRSLKTVCMISKVS